MNTFAQTVSNKSNNELLSMVTQFDEWSPEMLAAVEAELAERNILPPDLKKRKEELAENEDAQLQNGKEASVTGLIVGWLTVFGLLGIAIGYNYAFSKIRGKYTNKQYYKYDASSRKNGSYLFYTAVFLSAMAILYKLIGNS